MGTTRLLDRIRVQLPESALAFLILIIIPAVLAGVALAFLVSYGRLVLENLASAGRNPTAIAFLVVAVLIGLAFLIGRRFLSIALDIVSRLHHTLVFPIFVTLREVFRSISEWFPGMSNTQEHLYRRRRVGTVLAALLLGGSGLFLAISVELSFGFQLVDVEHIRPWAVARAVLGNAAIVLGFSTAAASVLALA